MGVFISRDNYDIVLVLTPPIGVDDVLLFITI